MVTILPMSQVTVSVSATAAGFCFVQNHMSTAIRHLSLMAQRVTDEAVHQPFTVCVSTLSGKPVYLPSYTAFRFALPSSVHVIIDGPASLGVRKVKGRGENRNEATPSKGNAKIGKDDVFARLDDDTVRQEVLQLLVKYPDL